MCYPGLKTSPKNLIYHKSVLLQPACDFLHVRPGALYIDATFGTGGHTAEIIRRGGQVLSMDQDPDTAADVHANFTHLEEIARVHRWVPVAGIIFDLGVSSHQIDTAERGFSFQKEGPLDMRMGNSAVTAAELVNQLSVDQLASVLREFGEIPTAKTLAAKIVAARPLHTTHDLSQVTGRWTRQAFQALRVAVNDELGAIVTTLPQALEILEPKGRLVVISFQSLEDRLVKEFFAGMEKLGQVEILTPKPVTAGVEEVAENPRSKSAKLRCLEKI